MCLQIAISTCECSHANSAFGLVFFMRSCLYTGASLCLYVLMQTAGLAGAQAELCAVCHGERCQQGHVHQKRSGQCAQQKQVRANVTWDICWHVSRTFSWASCEHVFALQMLHFYVNDVLRRLKLGDCDACKLQSGECYWEGCHRSGRCSQPAGPAAEDYQ